MNSSHRGVRNLVQSRRVLHSNPRRYPHLIDGKRVLFGTLGRHWTMPEPLSNQWMAYQRGESLDPQFQALLETHQILTPDGSEEAIFPLTETRAGGWTNSQRGRAILEDHPGPMVVLDALNLEDIAAMPRGGALLYLGDPIGGFYAAETCGTDGKYPCSRCLLTRYLAGRRACATLFQVLKEGARVAFPLPIRGPREIPSDSRFAVLGQDRPPVTAVLPLPDCPECLRNSRVSMMVPGLFSPVVSVNSGGTSQSASLGEMLWVSGEETVGGGGAYDEDPQRGVDRAINEALERYSAHFAPQGATEAGVPFVTSDGAKKLFPSRRALLTEPGSVSTGLACRDDLGDAIEDALREVCERDALARFWLALCKGQARLREVGEIETVTVRGFNFSLLTYQLDSHHQPTILCLGMDEQDRVVSGSACGPIEAASGKARAECIQNASYLDTFTPPAADPPQTFEEHISLYWQGLRKLPDLTPHVVENVATLPLPAPVYHCELTPPDITLLGLHAVRVQVPGLLHLPMAHEDWPTVLEEAGWNDISAPSQPHPFS